MALGKFRNMISSRPKPTWRLSSSSMGSMSSAATASSSNTNGTNGTNITSSSIITNSPNNSNKGSSKDARSPALITKKRENKLHGVDKPKMRTKKKKVTGAEIQQLRDLIRRKYRLDIRIWEQKEAKPVMHKEVWKLMNTADLQLMQIKGLVDGSKLTQW
jgi:hypothetical protein